MAERHDTVIIGGGQAGLAMSYYLREQGREHVVLERTRVAERWHSERWDSLYFQFPNWALRLPGFSYKGASPDAFSPYTFVARFVEDYARIIDAPVRCGVNVRSLQQEPGTDGFLIDTDDARIAAERIVVATGPFQKPAVPEFSKALPPEIFQVHASRYRNPQQLPPGAVLIVGSGASGCQIAEDLHQQGRAVYLCVSRHRRVPRRYRGRDLTWWFIDTGRLDIPIDNLPERRIPPSTVITGVDGGYDIDVRRFATNGMIVLGRLTGVAEGKIYLSDDAEQILAEADKTFLEFKRSADEHARNKRLDLPRDDGPLSVPASASIPARPWIDLGAANITSVVWGTGYDFDFGWLKMPVLDERGRPRQRRGVTDCANLYFLGLHWMHTFKSGLIFGVGEDAAYLVEKMTARD